MRKLTITDENEDFQEEQWEENGSVAFVTSASEDGHIVMWDVKSKEILQRIEGAHEGVCFWVDVHGETGTMVSCGQDGRIVVYRHRYPETPNEGDNGQTNGHAKDDEENRQRYPEESEERAPDTGDAEEMMMKVVEPAEMNGHAYPEGAGDEGKPVAQEGDVVMEE